MTALATRLRARLAGLRRDESGATAVFTGVLLVAALGFVGLGVDMGVGYAARRDAQSAADSAAFSGAVGQMAGAPNVADQARAVAANYGLKNGVDGVTVTVNTPPASGAQRTNAQAVEVIITRPGRRFFSGFVTSGATTIAARAVAVAGVAGDGCIVAFNPTDAMSVLNNGTGAVNLQNCSLWANSTNNWGFTQNGSGAFAASAINLGGAGYLNNGFGTVAGPVKLHQTLADPYADVNPPAPPTACDQTGYTAPAGSTTIDPGPDGVMNFCNGLTISGNNQTVTFKPGTYYISGADFLVNGNNTVVDASAGVTFVLTNRNGGAYAKATINGIGQTLKFTAPTSGPTKGIAIFQDRNAPKGGTNTLNGSGSTVSWQGAFYFKNQSVTINGSGQTSGGGCTQILADKVTFNGASSFGANCTGVGTRAIGGFPTTLVE